MLNAPTNKTNTNPLHLCWNSLFVVSSKTDVLTFLPLFTDMRVMFSFQRITFYSNQKTSKKPLSNSPPAPLSLSFKHLKSTLHTSYIWERHRSTQTRRPQGICSGSRANRWGGSRSSKATKSQTSLVPALLHMSNTSDSPRSAEFPNSLMCTIVHRHD